MYAIRSYYGRIFDYMLATCMVKPEYRDKLIGITHVDGSARLQLIDKENKYFSYNFV